MFTIPNRKIRYLLNAENIKNLKTNIKANIKVSKKIIMDFLFNPIQNYGSGYYPDYHVNNVNVNVDADSGYQPLLPYFTNQYGSVDSDKIETWDETVKRGIFDEEFKYPNPLTGNSTWSEKYKQEHINKLRKLGSYIDAKNIFDVVKNNQVTLITMGTGAGKTVMMPKIMLHYFAYQKKIAVTIPRKTITEGAGDYGAWTLDATLGKEVGLKHGSSKDLFSNETKLLYTTDGSIKAKMTSDDYDLKEYYSLIIDEAHERNVNIDVMFSLLKDLCIRRPEFKVIIMSATVDINVFKNFFEKNSLSFKHYHVGGEKPKYHIDKYFSDHETNPENYPAYMDAYLIKILQETSIGDIICFVPKLTAFSVFLNSYQKNKHTIQGNPCFIGYSGATATQEESDLVKKFDPETKVPYYMSKGYTRCVIVTTPALESSLTSAGKIVYVIDSGLCNSVEYDPVKYAFVSSVKYVPQSSIIQRQGRTGRVCSGQAYMLYSKELFDTFKEYSPPNILTSDITNDVLNIINLPQNQNLQNTLIFLSDMITPPTVESVENAVNILYNYSLIDNEGQITPLGKTSTKMGRLGGELTRMLLASYYFGCMDDVLLLVAVMNNSFGKTLGDYIRTPGIISTPEEVEFYHQMMKRFKHPRGDHFILLNIIKAYVLVHPKDRFKWCKEMKFNVDLFKAIEGDIVDIKESLERVEFPIMFNNFPPPKPFERPPTTLVEFFQKKNKEFNAQMFGKEAQQTRFTYSYGGGRSTRKSNSKKMKSTKIGMKIEELTEKYLSPQHSEQEPFISSRTYGVKMCQTQPNNTTETRDTKTEETDEEIIVLSSRTILPEETRKNEDFTNINNRFNNPKYKHIQSTNESRNLSSDYLTHDSVKKTSKKLIKIIDENYKVENSNEHHDKKDIQGIEDDKDNDKDNETTEVSVSEAIQEDLIDKDTAFMDDMLYRPLSSEEIKKDNEENKAIESSLKPIHIDTKLVTKKVKTTRSKSKKKSYKTRKSKSKSRKFKLKSKLKKSRTDLEFQSGGNKDNDDELVQYGLFLDQISLKTESGILPLFRKFEDNDENILACIFYGFYMRLGFNTNKNNYLIKLSKIIAKNKKNYFAFVKEAPELVIYQNLSIDLEKNMTTIGIVSKLTPRIINSFI